MKLNRNVQRNLSLLTALTLLVIGILSIVIAVMSARNTIIFKKNASYSNGVVISLVYGGSHPEIQFYTQSGEKIIYLQGGIIFGYKLNDQVKILYDPKSPFQTASVDSIGSLWFIEIILSFIGAIFIVCGVRYI